jgi:uncharacterized protein YcfL
MNKMLRLAGLTLLLLAGCADNQIVSYSPDENYMTFDHAFTDKVIADVQARAEKLCGQRKQMAIQTSRTCSLTKCATNYQCVDAADIVKYGL